MKMINKILNRLANNSLVGVMLIFILILGFGSSWIITCGIVKLITLCFGWSFKWSFATGIWLILILIKNLIDNNK